jgi:hypothetical protein
VETRQLGQLAEVDQTIQDSDNVIDAEHERIQNARAAQLQATV